MAAVDLAPATGPLGPTAPPDLPRTVGELRACGWVSRGVKAELRSNLLAALRRGEPRFPGVVGFDDTVLPELERALLAGHDVVLLGERGQGKTRLLRGLVSLLDEWSPYAVGSEIFEDPLSPVLPATARLLAEQGEAAPVAWRHRSERYGEKLATPDTSVGDLIGDVDPVKVAQGRSLGDPETIHFGLLPRTHRGVFAVNELPDLAERIQVSLLNVLEERDLQVRGYAFRLPVDVLLVASANPEDYTNRGRIITPLKDRFGAEVRTHYPIDLATEIELVRAEAALPDALSSAGGDARGAAGSPGRHSAGETAGQVPGPAAGQPRAAVPAPGEPAAEVPDHLVEVLARWTRHVRDSPAVDARSGVSARFAITAVETVAAAAQRRAALLGESGTPVARASDLEAAVGTLRGKVEFESGEEGREYEVLSHLLRLAAAETFRDRLGGTELSGVLALTAEGGVVDVGEDVPVDTLLTTVGTVEGLGAVCARLGFTDVPSPAQLASAVEFVLEGLHLTRRLAKDPLTDGRVRYRARRTDPRP